MVSKSQEALIEELVQCGIQERAAQLYVHLLATGPQSATEISQSTGAHRNQVYRDMEALTQGDLATQTVERPARFVAAPPQRLLAGLQSALEQQRGRVERFEAEAVPALERLAASGPAVEEEVAQIRHLNGRKEILDETIRLLGRAKESVEFVLTHPEAIRIAHMGGLWPLLWTAGQRGLQVRGIVAASMPLDALLENAPGETDVRRLQDAPAMHMILVDGKEALVTATMDPSQALRATLDQAMWTDARAMLPAFAAAFAQFWHEAEPMDRPVRPPRPGSGGRPRRPAPGATPPGETPA